MNASPLTLVVTSYNQRATLALLFASLELQTCLDFHVLVADDGSSDGTPAWCAKYLGKFRVSCVTQPDEGYRKAKILNQALRHTQSPYLIFLDADVVIEKNFIADHLQLRRPGAFVCGRRVDLSPSLTSAITADFIAHGGLDSPTLSLICDGIWGETENWKRAFRVRAPWLRSLLKYDRPLDILGSNLGVWREDLVAINGFNEALQSYWGEDGDLFIRLRNSGRIAIGAKNICIQYHLFHPRRVPDPANVAAYEKMLRDTQYRWCEKGLES